MNIPRNKG